MSIPKILLVIAVLATYESQLYANGYMRVCYFASWAYSRGTSAKHMVGDINPNLCTHLIYAFAKLNRDVGGLEIFDTWGDGPGGHDQISKFNALKQQNPNLKTLISVGGQNDHSDGFKAISRTDAILKNFASSAVSFMRQHGFDGLDVDWEFPDNSTKDTFVKILKVLRETFDNETSDPSNRLLLSIAGAAGQWFIDPGYDVPEVAKYIDFANIMTYDYTSSAAEITAFNSPLYSRNDPRFNAVLSTNWTIHYWHEKGMPYNKMTMGFTGVGRLLVLKDKTQYVPGSPVTGEKRKGPYYSIEAGLAFPEICEWLKYSETKKYFDNEQKNPYLVKGDNWVGYEDDQSLEIKIEWMQQLGLAGFMFWSLDQDDFTGEFCCNGKYPLLNAAIEALPIADRPTLAPQPTVTCRTTSTTTTTKPTTPSSTTTTTTTTKPTTSTTTTTPVVVTAKPTPATEKPQTDKPATVKPATEAPDDNDGDGASSLQHWSVTTTVLVSCLATLFALVSWR